MWFKPVCSHPGWQVCSRGGGWCSLNGRVTEVFEAKALDEAGVGWAVAAGAADVWRALGVPGGAAAAQGRGQAADGGARGECLNLGMPSHNGWGQPPE